MKNINITIPKNKLVVFTGVSGSGKSTLVFDTIYAESQRRFMAGFSAFARRNLQKLEKPKYDFIDGLIPAIAIEQKGIGNNPRSTVGTITEISDYLRLLYSRVGIRHCIECKTEIIPETPKQICKGIFEKVGKGEKVKLITAISLDPKLNYKDDLEKLIAKGIHKVKIEDKVYDIDELMKNKISSRVYAEVIGSITIPKELENNYEEYVTKYSMIISKFINLGIGTLRVEYAEGLL